MSTNRHPQQKKVCLHVLRGSNPGMQIYSVTNIIMVIKFNVIFSSDIQLLVFYE